MILFLIINVSCLTNLINTRTLNQKLNRFLAKYMLKKTKSKKKKSLVNTISDDEKVTTRTSLHQIAEKVLNCPLVHIIIQKDIAHSSTEFIKMEISIGDGQ
jgi:hypothetical protein